MRTVGVQTPTTRLTFGSTSAVTNVPVTPAAKPCNVIAGRKYIGGSDSECAIRLVLTLIFACRRGGEEICRRGLNLGCVADRITNITHKWKH